MNTILKHACIGCIAALGMLGECQAVDVSIANFTFNAAHRSKPIQALVWYPAQSGGTKELIGDNPVFVGTPALRDAVPQSGKHPLVILSHGSGGNAANLGWISAKLVQAGYVVIAPNHPGSTSGNSRPETNVKFWERPQDMTALLNALESSVEFSENLDTQHTVAMGFSAGGHTALALAGAKVHAASLAKYCNDMPEQLDCQWYAKGNKFIPGHVDLHKIDAAAFDAGYKDPRIKSVVAIDPALALAYDTISLSAVKVPTMVMNLGDESTVPVGVAGKSIAASISGATFETISGAAHLSFLGLCKPEGEAIIAEEGDDPICTDPPGRSRADVHKEIAGKILDFLKTNTSTIN